MRRAFVLGLMATLALAACDRPAVRTQKRAPVPRPAIPPGTPLVAAPVHLFPDDPPSPVVWNPARGAFTFKGQVLRAEKLWTFDGATDGFVATHGEVLPSDGAGLSVRVDGRDAMLRTPRGLNVEGATRSLLLVHLTRTAAVKRWDPTVYYSTAAHGESQAYFAKPVFGGHPRLNDTVTMVFDMRHPAAGGDDWKSSIIDQVRLDVDDGAGGAFIVHQVAIAQDPGGITPQPPAPPKADPDKAKPGGATPPVAAKGETRPAAKSEPKLKPQPKPAPDPHQ